MPKRIKKKNKLKEIRIHEGLSISELSRLSNVSPPTIRKIESSESSTEVTKNKIIIGLNKNPDKTKGYIFKGVFPR